jgi:PAS domain S-box-containing protein
MLTSWLLALMALAYLGLLFAIAWLGDRYAAAGRAPVPRPLVYSLSLAVYCTSWAYYGTVGQSASLGWWLPPTYAGTLVLFLLALPLLDKLIRVSRRERITSVADFVAARYGRDRALAVGVTVIAVCGVTPYIALQLKAIEMSFNVLAAGSPRAAQDTALYVAATLALFAILFGTRHVEATEHHPGMMLAVAFESLVKLVAFLAVGLYVTFGMFDGFGDLATRAAAAAPSARAGGSSVSHFLALMVLGFVAIFCLPRQFHVAVVENGGPRDLALARWLFPVYLLAISVFILPLANAGLALGLPDADLYVLTVPLGAGAEVLTIFAFIGGLSAATGMVIVASVALSTMISNEIAVPLAMQLSPTLRQGRDLTGFLLAVRRVAIVLLLGLAWLYYRWIAQNGALASIGEIGMAAVALFGPAIVAGLYWRGATRVGALASIGAGFAIWLWTLLVPALAEAGLAPESLVTAGPWGIEWLRPTALFGVEFDHTLAHGLGWSLLAATAALVLGSRQSARSLGERIQAAAFVDAAPRRPAAGFDPRVHALTVRELRTLAERFAGAERAAVEFEGLDTAAATRATAEQLETTQRLLASVVGAASAQRLLDAAVAGRELEIEDVVQIVDGASQALAFSRELLQATVENLSQGVAVVDADLRLVAWNHRYLELFRYPADLIRIGRPIEEVLRYNAVRGELGEGEPEALVQRRLEHLRRGTAYTFQRVRRDGIVLEIRGNPMPGGGFVTSYADVTDYKRTEQALKESNELLERRVAQRTRALQVMNEELLVAKAEAERANLGKTRFLAAAGHDLLQPLNAAGLFAAALAQKASTAEQRNLLTDLDRCLESAEALLSDLLDISKLDAGVIRGEVADLALGPLLAELDSEFRLQAVERGLALRLRGTDAWVRSDRKLLHRVLQNFIGNALRYTSRGGVLIGARRRQGGVRITVWDTGRGMPDQEVARVFEEFYRGAAAVEAAPGRGFGLGLAIAERIARVLDHRVGVRSRPGRGSVFWIDVAEGKVAPVAAALPDPRAAGSLAGVRALCVDNDAGALKGLAALLETWGCEVVACTCLAELPPAGRQPDVLLVDYHLDGGMTGLDVVRHLRDVEHVQAPAIVVSADANEQVRAEAEARGCVFLRKPLKPLQLRSALRRVLEERAA